MFFTRIKNKLEYERDKMIWRCNLRAVEKCKAWQNAASIDETLDELLKGKCSMSRYGDGELKVMIGLSNGFQKEDAALAERLRQILSSKEDGMLICIPNISGDTALRTPDGVKFWHDFLRWYGKRWAKLLAKDGNYYNAHVTRLYIDYRTCGKCGGWFARLKQVWQDKDILIVEGEKTRLGTGNDLFAGCRSIRRVICPAKSAFSQYDEILNTVKDVWNGELVLIALGQTATVLAYDLHKAGIRALDVGHVDIEYEWFLNGATEKTAIAGKYVNEVDSQIEGDGDAEYEKQIVRRIIQKADKKENK